MASERPRGIGHDLVVAPSGGLDELAGLGARRVSALLQAGIPLSLLLDLAEPDGPDSALLYATEVSHDRVDRRDGAVRTRD